MAPPPPGYLQVLLLVLLPPEARPYLRQRLRSPAAAEELLGDLSALGWLTPFQVERLLAGTGASLVVAGRYILQERVGQGGMGIVYRAWDGKLRRTVAVKFLRAPTHLGSGLQDHCARRFAREAALHGRLGSHTNLVCLFDTGTSAGRPFLVLEWVDGPDLFRLVQKSGPLPWPRACRLVRDLCLALEHLRRAGMTHRDVKPSNLVLAPDGRVRLLDLGLARDEAAGEPAAGEPLTPAAAAMGTPGYMAPEAFRDCHRVDARADLFSAAAVLYFLGTGRQPFAADRPTGVRFRNARPVLPSFHGIPRAVRAVLRRALARDPSRRYPDPRRMAAALDRCRATRRRARERETGRQRAGSSKPLLLLLVSVVALAAWALLRLL
jgi:serine/threonine-protein kinase